MSMKQKVPCILVKIAQAALLSALFLVSCSLSAAEEPKKAARRDGKARQETATKSQDGISTLQDDLARLAKTVRESYANQNVSLDTLHAELSSLEESISASCNSPNHCCKEVKESLNKVSKKLTSCCDQQSSCCSTLENGITTLGYKIDQCCSSSSNCCDTLQTGIEELQTSLTTCCAKTHNDIAQLKKKITCCCNQQASCCATLESGIASLESKLDDCCSSSSQCCSTLQSGINQIQTSLNSCCAKTQNDIAQVHKKLNSCCAQQEACCTTLTTGIASLESKLDECCSSSTQCCSTLQSGINQIQTSLNTCCAKTQNDIAQVQNTLNSCCAQQQICCNTLESGITSIEDKLDACCKASSECCSTLQDEINQLQKTLDGCCSDQAACCQLIMQTLARIESLLLACCNGGGGGGGCCETCIFISFIPPGGLELSAPGHYVVVNDLFYEGSTPSSVSSASHARLRSASSTDTSLRAETDQLGQNGPCPEPVPPVNFGITITSDNVFLDFNNHSLTITGENVGGVVVVNGVTKSQVAGGTVVGNNVVGQVGVGVTGVGVVVNNVSFANIGVQVPVQLGVVTVVGAVSVVGVAVVAAAVVVAPVVVAAVVAEAETGLGGVPQQTPSPQAGVLIENVGISGSVNGISIQGSVANVIIRNVAIKDSFQMGIYQPSRSGFHGNFFLENVQITDSGLHGIYTTFNQDNWILKNVQIRNSQLSGAIFEGFQNLMIKDSQILESGTKGLVASIRQSQNISLSDLEVFNSGEEALRIDNVQTLSINDCSFTNYTASTLPLAKIQDVNNGLIKNSQFTSLGGNSDGLFIRNSHGLILDSNVIKVSNNFSSDTPTPQPPHTTGSTIGHYIQQKFCEGMDVTFPSPGAPDVSRGPVGLNLHGGVTAAHVRNTVISGTPDIGIAVQTDSLNGFDEGVILENVLVDGAQRQGILFAGALNSAVLNSQILNSQGDGIAIDSASSQTAARGNTLTNNRGFGIRNRGLNSQIFHNFASANGINYTSNILSSRPTAGLGSLENISS